MSNQPVLQRKIKTAGENLLRFLYIEDHTPGAWFKGRRLPMI
ncbi:hypothetical protein CLOSTMETH_02892 [[Clostridium] methylpentosum DSM 5476]|uniref:Uncharacterized protein n=1 Tax=[Clostridium] methylpentosum DSM 5476 TaxID=537013 RepID=C0EG99_9FIRM|nr:hypothetical protein CLOSTMETH_02892 [[Clostridium] methylpentosum DSM 5476]